MVQPYNAKNLPFDRPGAGAFNYGVNIGNVGAKLTKLWGARGENTGGSKAMYDKLVSWASPEAIIKRGGNPNDTQWKLWQDYFKTGQVDPNLNTGLAVRGLDLGLRETARAQQHKQSFFDTPFGKILGMGLTAGAAFLPGGQFLAPAIGATYGGVSDGWKGALLGGLSGYGAGQLAGGIKNAAGATGGWLSSIKNPGDFFHNLWNGGPGALTSGAQIGGSGGSMGVFGDILSAGNYGGGNLWGDLLKGGLSYFGNRQAMSGLDDAAERAFNASQFIPYN